MVVFPEIGCEGSQSPPQAVCPAKNPHPQQRVSGGASNAHQTLARPSGIVPFHFLALCHIIFRSASE
jgi:hypothetical protein